jgi:hypothetical protein
MNKTLAPFILASTLAVSALVAAPASAAALTPVSVTCDGSNLVLSSNNIGARLFDTIAVTNSTGGDLSQSGLNNLTATIPGLMTNGQTGTYTVRGLPGSTTFTGTGPCNASSVTLSLVSGGGGGPSTASARAPQTFVLSFVSSSGATCAISSESGTGGTWITLPSAGDCTPPAGKENAKLLGWATTPSFPVAVAQTQVNNGWGTFEGYNSDGQLVSVFIPAGRAAYLSGNNTLYAIWSS